VNSEWRESMGQSSLEELSQKGGEKIRSKAVKKHRVTSAWRESMGLGSLEELSQ
jgi:hypothetical protein